MEDDAEAEFSQFGGLVHIEIGRRDKRPLCEKCSRPNDVCWCKSISGSKMRIKCTIVLLQHPHEEKRCLRTSPILEALIPKDHFIELKGKRFSSNRFPQLQEILGSSNSIVLYPGKEAKLLEDLPVVSASNPPYNIIILDGTWQQAKSMYYRNPCLQNLQQIRLSGKHSSQYVIRTQPTEEALSSVETAAVALSTLEDDWTIYTSLVEPLRLICDFQMNHGAVKHQSKEQLILAGKYNKPLGKRTYKKLRKCGVRNGNISVQELLSIAEEQKQKEEKIRLKEGTNEEIHISKEGKKVNEENGLNSDHTGTIEADIKTLSEAQTNSQLPLKDTDKSDNEVKDGAKR